MRNEKIIGDLFFLFYNEGMRKFLLTFPLRLRILFNKQGARALCVTDNPSFDKEDSMQHYLKNSFNNIIKNQGAFVLERV